MNLLTLPVAVPPLNAFEQQVLRLALQGLYPNEIAALLNLNVAEVDGTLRTLANLHVQANHSQESEPSGDYGHGAAVWDWLIVKASQ